MRVLLHDYAGHPFQIQLSRALAARGHEVLHLYAADLQTPRGALEPSSSDPPNLTIRPIGLGEPIRKYDFVRRRAQEVRYGRLAAAEIERFRPDVVLSANTNLDPQRILQRAARRVGARFVFWLQDALGEGARRLLRRRWWGLGWAAGTYYAFEERRLLRRSDGVVAITEDFRELLDRARVPASRVAVVENWAPVAELPLRERDNAWARRHGLVGSRVFLYSGTLGMKHNPELLVRLALELRKEDGTRVVVASEGLGASHIRKRIEEDGIDNLVLLPFQPYAEVPDMLGSADVLIAHLEPDAGVFAVPSKVLSYLCAGRALLLAVPPENLAARIVAKAGAGVVVHPHDVEGFLAGAERLLHDPHLRNGCAANARRYAESTFDISRITDRFEAILSGNPATG